MESGSSSNHWPESFVRCGQWVIDLLSDVNSYNDFLVKNIADPSGYQVSHLPPSYLPLPPDCPSTSREPTRIALAPPRSHVDFPAADPPRSAPPAWGMNPGRLAGQSTLGPALEKIYSLLPPSPIPKQSGS